MGMLEKDLRILHARIERKKHRGKNVSKMQAAYNEGIEKGLEVLNEAYSKRLDYDDAQDAFTKALKRYDPGFNGNRLDAYNAAILACKSIIKNYFKF